MKWITDRTGRFPQRPFYEPGELDQECEAIVTSFLIGKNGKVSYPVSTNDLTIILENEVEDLDLFADLTNYGDDIEGMTEFFPGKKPSVKVAHELSETGYRENRLRTTLTHEFGHVKFHNFLWFFKQDQLFLTDSYEKKQKQDHDAVICKRETILNASEVDWMEWQAGYASGAFLMPITVLTGIVRSFYASSQLLSVASPVSPEGGKLINLVKEKFQVSEDAARVRLIKLKFLAEQQKTPHF